MHGLSHRLTGSRRRLAVRPLFVGAVLLGTVLFLGFGGPATGAPAPVNAGEDSIHVSHGTTGVVLNVLDNDYVDFTTPATADNVTISDLGGGDVYLFLDTTSGDLSLNTGAQAGEHSLQYQICDRAPTPVCDTATATVTVDPATVSANDDWEYLSGGWDGGYVLNVLDNDTYDDVQADTSNVSLHYDADDAPLSLDESNGAVSVAAKTPSGDYYLDYELCDQENPSNCMNATVEVYVDSNEISASYDTNDYTVYGSYGGLAIDNVLANDTFAGGQATVDNVVLKKDSMDSGLSFDESNGQVSVDPGLPSGAYYLDYEICDSSDAFNCDYGEAEVWVDAVGITASNDENDRAITAFHAGVAIDNVLANDSYDGGPANTGNVNLSQDYSDDPGVNLDTSNGQVTVDASVASGDYELDYEICDATDEYNCDYATAWVSVDGRPIKANYDEGTISRLTGGDAVTNVLANDTFDGGAATTSSVTLSEDEDYSDSELTLDTNTGAVSVAAGTYSGWYYLYYEICDQADANDCSYAFADVLVTGAPIDAVEDSGTVASGVDGGVAVANVLANDTIDGSPATFDNVFLYLDYYDPGLSLNESTGAVSVAPSTPGGEYSLGYEICVKGDSNNCDDTEVNVTVPNLPPVAANDTATTNAGTAVTIPVLANDSDSDRDSLTITSASPAASHGTVSCTANACTYTPAVGYSGSDSFSYTISDGHGHSATANVSVTINAGPSSAIPSMPQKPKVTKTTLSISHIALIKSASKLKVRPGESFSYRITLKNTGTIAARNLVIGVVKSRKLVYLSTSKAKASKSRLTWKIGSLAAKKSRILTIKVKVSAKAAPGTIRTSATASATNGVRGVGSTAKIKVLRPLH